MKTFRTPPFVRASQSTFRLSLLLLLALRSACPSGAFAGDLLGSADLPPDFAHANAPAAFPSPAARAPIVHHPTSWWDEDVWADPDRPFLYYGDPHVPDLRPGAPKTPAETPKAEDPAKEAKEAKETKDKPFDPEDFSAFKTVEALKAERERRLNAAVMTPTPANMQSYQAINAHMLALSARFAQAWQYGRMMNPGYDFTTTSPSANFATVELAGVNRQRADALVTSLQGDAGLLFIGRRGDPLTAVAAGPVRAFANTWGLELLAVADGIDEAARGDEVPSFEGFERVQPDAGRAKSLGISTLPAVVLVPNPKAMTRPDFALLKGGLAGRDGMLIAAGAVSGEELSRRLVFLLSNPKGFEETPRITRGATHPPPGGEPLPADPTVWALPENGDDRPPAVIPSAEDIAQGRP